MNIKRLFSGLLAGTAMTLAAAADSAPKYIFY